MLHKTTAKKLWASLVLFTHNCPKQKYSGLHLSSLHTIVQNKNTLGFTCPLYTQLSKWHMAFLPCASQAHFTMQSVCIMKSVIIIIIIIIKLKGAIQDCLQFPHCATNCLQHTHSKGQGAIMYKSHATHTALITCNMLCVTWYEGTVQLLRLEEFKLHLF